MGLSGVINSVRDPEAAILKRDDKSFTDFSIGVQVQVLPDKPMGIELRKVGEEETLKLYEAGH